MLNEPITQHNDPSGFWGLLGAAVGAVLSLLLAFGIDLTPDQVKAILGVIAAGGPLVTALLIRRKAWAPASVEREVAIERALYTDLSFNAGKGEADDNGQ